MRQARPRQSGEVFDAQERDPALREAFEHADRKAERAVGNVPRDDNFIFRFWAEKKRILLQEYGIDWKTPAELNPTIKYANYGQPRITEAEEGILRALVLKELTSSTEAITGLLRSSEGVTMVFTYDSQSQRHFVYRFLGHDDTWTRIDGRECLIDWMSPR